MSVVQVDEDSFDEAREDGVGWCPGCEEFTTPDVPATSLAVTCATCLGDRVLGAVSALRGGFIAVEREVLA